MDSVVVRLLTPADFDAAFALSTTAGWNQRLEDWQMLWRLAPAASFAAIADARLVATAIGLDYGGFGWIAMMLVDPAWRGRGLGARLLEAAMSAIPGDRPIRLDATPLGRPLYERYGFKDEARLTRYVRDAPPRPDMSPASMTHVSPMSHDDLDIVAVEDRAVFDGDRRAVLEWALRDSPGYAQVMRTDAGAAQYCFGRRGRLFDQIGPVAAGDEQSARDLVSAALAASDGRPVQIDAFDAAVTFTDWLQSHGFQAQRPLFRMRRATVPSRAEPKLLAELAILGPEFA
jgi:GNAT superfamily N-acetyltransferase